GGPARPRPRKEVRHRRGPRKAGVTLCAGKGSSAGLARVSARALGRPWRWSRVSLACAGAAGGPGPGGWGANDVLHIIIIVVVGSRASLCSLPVAVLRWLRSDIVGVLFLLLRFFLLGRFFFEILEVCTRHEMAIISSFVSFQRILVAEDHVTSPMRPVVNVMLERLPSYDTKVSYQYEANVYHFLIENEIVYCCVSGNQYQNRTVFGFLMQVRDSFKSQFAGNVSRYPRSSEMTPAVCGKFRTTLADLTRTFNENPQADKIGKINEQLDSTKQVMLENLDRLIDRGERIESLCDKTEQLRDEAQGFHSNTRALKRKMLIRNIKLAIALILVLGLVGLI
ncbi:putative vesicle-associated membrane protein, partial [Trypanosoma conorhini]